MRSTAKIIATMLSLILLAGVRNSGTKLDQRQRALHVLNRLAFGPRPGDVDRILKTGVDVWIDEQLHPEQIPDRAVEAKLQQYPTLQMSDTDIMRKYYAPVLMARQQAKRAAAANLDMTAATTGSASAVAQSPPATPAAASADSAKDLAREMRQRIPPDQRPQRVTEELTAQRLIRAVDSDRQLNEVMVDFWMNHFNVFAGKGIDRFMLTSYERDVIRPHIWGRFEDLLMATAKSPAMLFYLDNAQSVADPEHRPKFAIRRGGAGTNGRAEAAIASRRDDVRPGAAVSPATMPPANATAAAPQQGRRGGLNENYAREIMELHTLGVDAGYTQKDVTELARVLTGWTIARPNEGGGFIFRPALHDVGEKTVLGVHFPAGGGIEEGEKMIHILAHHPATAHHIALQLCQRLVSDNPPKALVDRVAKKFLASDGDLRETVKAVIDSPEFWDPSTYRAKVKSPLEYVTSAVRAVGATVDDPLPLARQLVFLGEPLYGAQPPTGYSDRGDVWVNTGALMGRLNFALALAANKMPGVHSDVTTLIPAEAASDASKSVDALAVAITGGGLSDETRATIKSRIVERKSPQEDPWDNTQLPTVAALILGSPEFQKQ